MAFKHSKRRNMTDKLSEEVRNAHYNNNDLIDIDVQIDWADRIQALEELAESRYKLSEAAIGRVAALEAEISRLQSVADANAAYGVEADRALSIAIRSKQEAELQASDSHNETYKKALIEQSTAFNERNQLRNAVRAFVHAGENEDDIASMLAYAKLVEITGVKK